MLGTSITNQVRQALNCPDLEFYLKPEWSSQSTDHRQAIRQYIFDNIKDEQGILDLKKIPSLSEGAVSISHNKEIGGFIHSGILSNLGFDIETSDRLTKKSASYYSVNEAEIDQAPFISSLWTVKEAAFKWLYKTSRQPTVIREIEIGNWKKVSDDVYTCEAIKVQDEEAPPGLGLVFKIGTQTMAIFTERTKGSDL